MRSYLKKAVLVLVVFGVGFGLGWISRQNQPPAIENVREDSPDYKFINPLLFVKVPEDQAFPEYAELKQTIADYVDRVKRDRKADEVSVYFRNLNSSQWIYVNPDIPFTPASMLKVVVLVSTLRAAESEPRLLTKIVTLAGDDSRQVGVQTAYHPPKNPVRVGGTYTINELVSHLITESDNVASSALIKGIGEDRILKTYDDLRLHRPEAKGLGYTAREYSYLFRALYNGTYLSRPVSEQVLNLLSRTDYDEGLVKLLPADTVVSHKFGVSAVAKEGATADIPGSVERQLHDCGIIYFPENPYFLCVMTKGFDFTELEKVIQGVSKIVWDELEEVRK